MTDERDIVERLDYIKLWFHTTASGIMENYIQYAIDEIIRLRERLDLISDEKTFPVLRSTMTDGRVPFAMVLEHEGQCLKNHSQTVNRLAERGGLGWAELLAVLEDRPWSNVPFKEAKHIVSLLADAWREPENAILRRECVRLRAELAVARDKALEEAATQAEELEDHIAADAIRAMKGTPNAD